MQPNPVTVRRTAVLLASLEPDAAGDTAAMIMDAIGEGLRRNGHTREDAEHFAVSFGRAVLDRLRQMVRPAGVTLH